MEDKLGNNFVFIRIMQIFRASIIYQSNLTIHSAKIKFKGVNISIY